MSAFARKRPWREIPAGYYVFGGGRWFEVLSNVFVDDGLQEVRLRHEEREGVFSYPENEEVMCKPGPRAMHIARAIQAFADPFEVKILEDRPPWDEEEK